MWLQSETSLCSLCVKSSLLEGLVFLQEDGFPHSLCHAKMRSLMKQPAVNTELEYVIQKTKDWIELRVDKGIILFISFQLPEPLTGKMTHNLYFQKNLRGNYLARAALKESFWKICKCRRVFSRNYLFSLQLCKKMHFCGLQWAAHTKKSNT